MFKICYSLYIYIHILFCKRLHNIISPCHSQFAYISNNACKPKTLGKKTVKSENFTCSANFDKVLTFSLAFKTKACLSLTVSITGMMHCNSTYSLLLAFIDTDVLTPTKVYVILYICGTETLFTNSSFSNYIT